jgi:hypothetical protein
MLFFGNYKNNKKLSQLGLMVQAQARGYDNIITFSLPAGYSCPFAKECLSKADRYTGRVLDGPHTTFRCYAASIESVFPQLRNRSWNNFELLRIAAKADGSIGMANLIEQSLEAIHAFDTRTIVRIHVSGDFYNQSYMRSWMRVASRSPSNLYYAYTKALPYWVALEDIPENFRLIASAGGTADAYIEQYNLRYARVVFSQAEADHLGLRIDHDDTIACFEQESFALLLHGTQPRGSAAAKAVIALRKAA